MPALLFIGRLFGFGFITLLFPALKRFFVSFLSYKVIKSSLRVTIFLALLFGLNKLILSALTELSVILPDDILQNLGCFLPDNAFKCFYALLIVRAAIFVFNMKNLVFRKTMGEE